MSEPQCIFCDDVGVHECPGGRVHCSDPVAHGNSFALHSDGTVYAPYRGSLRIDAAMFKSCCHSSFSERRRMKRYERKAEQ